MRTIASGMAADRRPACRSTHAMRQNDRRNPAKKLRGEPGAMKRASASVPV
jgi:hypothetical protein